MKKYRIHVNGKTYEVAVEEIDGAASAAVASPQREASPSSPVQPAPAAADEMLVSPMPGKIVFVAVKQGQTVREGDLIFILEAMKMENDILCGRAGVVKEIRVTENAQVNTGDVLAIIG